MEEPATQCITGADQERGREEEAGEEAEGGER